MKKLIFCSALWALAALAPAALTAQNLVATTATWTGFNLSELRYDTLVTSVTMPSGTELTLRLVGDTGQYVVTDWQAFTASSGTATRTGNEVTFTPPVAGVSQVTLQLEEPWLWLEGYDFCVDGAGIILGEGWGSFIFLTRTGSEVTLDATSVSDALDGDEGGRSTFTVPLTPKKVATVTVFGVKRRIILLR